MRKRKGIVMDLGLGPASPPDAAWHNPQKLPFAISGFAWFKQDRKYRRMPIKPEWRLPPNVDELADCTAGGQIRFQTDNRTLADPETYHATQFNMKPYNKHIVSSLLYCNVYI